MKKLYSAEYAKKNVFRSIAKLLPTMPSNKSKRYKNAERLIINAGLGISAVDFYLKKTLLFVIGLVFAVSIQTTNIFYLYNSIISDPNTDKTLIDIAAEPGADVISLEKEIFKYVDSILAKEKVTLKELRNAANSQMYIEYLESRIGGKWADIGEDSRVIAERMFKKLKRIRAIEGNCLRYAAALGLALLMYFIPEIAGYIKLILIEDKRDWEILNFIYVFSMFGRMPPYSIKNVLANTLVVADIYKPVITEALNGIKNGKGEDTFGSLLQKVENQDLYELLESMRLSMSTGLLNMVDSIDEMAANQLKWLEIKSMKRRKTKQIIAMVPVVLIMLIAMIYFSYSLSTLSNPMSYINQ